MLNPRVLALSLLCLLPLSINAALIPQLDGEVLFDDDLGIVFLADMSLGASETFGVEGIGENGEMNWFTANNFIDAMNTFDGGAGWLGINNWRLPETVIPDPGCETTASNPPPSFGFNCTLSEMGHLYYIEWGRDDTIDNDASRAAAEANGFRNLTFFPYWSGTENVGSSAYDFFFSGGSQATLSKAFDGGVLPVATVAPIPVPAAAWLFGSALALMAGLRRLANRS
jgi:hypothetical protein